MGVHLYFSNQLMPLAERLRQNLDSESMDAGVLDAPVVIVPNMNLSKWIKLTLSRQSDAFMNVTFSYLEDGLWQMIREQAPQADLELERIGQEGLKILIFFILMALDDENEAVQPIARYLKRPDGGPGGDVALRCWQLAVEGRVQAACARPVHGTAVALFS